MTHTADDMHDDSASPLAPVAVKGETVLFDFEPQIAFSHFGPERSLRWILEWFYKSNGIDDAKAKAVTASYIAALATQPLVETKPLPADGVRDAANSLLANMSSTYKAKNGREIGIEADDGEKCWIVHSDYTDALRSALAQKALPSVEVAELVERLWERARNRVPEEKENYAGMTEVDFLEGQAAALLSSLSAEITALKAGRDSWRRVAERLEGDKQSAESSLTALREKLEKAALPYVVEYRRKDEFAWRPMAAFDVEGAAESYAKKCGEIDSPWEYRYVALAPAEDAQ